jgi:serine/threonine-protein kinase HipA
MARKRRHAPLRVYQNNRLVGRLLKETSGAISFQYDEGWLGNENAFPVSLSLPVREEAYRGERVAAVFDNLLPDSGELIRRVAEKVGAAGTDTHSMLAAIGRDCVGALQFIGDDDRDDVPGAAAIEGEAVSDERIEAILNNLAQAPLGLDQDDAFRISVAGAQEKTALLFHDGKWLKPHGTTPTTHILKTRIGKLPEGVDLTNSVENEFYCLKLMAAFGLTVNHADIRTFGNTTSLVIERFDRQWTKDGRLLRLPQEDCCQALSAPPTRKYEAHGGPGIEAIADLLKGSDTPQYDQLAFLKAQILFWLIGATDGHAKNFSIFLMPGGGFRMTPFYDVLTAQPSLDNRQIGHNRFKLAMCVGESRHYRIDEIQARHFLETGAAAGLPKTLVRRAIGEITDSHKAALEHLTANLPKGFPGQIHASVSRAFMQRIVRLAGVDA